MLQTAFDFCCIRHQLGDPPGRGKSRPGANTRIRRACGAVVGHGLDVAQVLDGHAIEPDRTVVLRPLRRSAHPVLQTRRAGERSRSGFRQFGIIPVATTGVLDYPCGRRYKSCPCENGRPASPGPWARAPFEVDDLAALSEWHSNGSSARAITQAETAVDFLESCDYVLGRTRKASSKAIVQYVV